MIAALWCKLPLLGELCSCVGNHKVNLADEWKTAIITTVNKYDDVNKNNNNKNFNSSVVTCKQQ